MSGTTGRPIKTPSSLANHRHEHHQPENMNHLDDEHLIKTNDHLFGKMESIGSPPAAYFNLWNYILDTLDIPFHLFDKGRTHDSLERDGEIFLDNDLLRRKPIPSETSTPFIIFDETKPYSSLEIWHEKYLWWRIILVSNILLIGMIGNLAIIYSIWKVPRFRSKPTNIFILNMAIGDLITATFCPIVALIKVVNEFYVMGPIICSIEGFIKITCLFVSSYSLIVLSFQWLICVIRPFWKRMTALHSWIALAIIWILSLSMGIPLIFTRTLISRKWSNLVERWCQEDTKFITYYWITVCFSLIYVPTICMTVALVIILMKLDKFGNKLRKSIKEANGQCVNTNPSSRRIIGSLDKMTTSNDYGNNQVVVDMTCDHDKSGSQTSASNNINNNNNNNFNHRVEVSLGSSNSSHSIQLSSFRTQPQQASNTVNEHRQQLSTLTPDPSISLNVNMKYRRHIVSILLIYLLVSVVCWAPLNLSIIYRLMTIRKTSFANTFLEFNFFCELAVATSAALNPIIFGFLSRPFRQLMSRFWDSCCNFICASSGRQKVRSKSKQQPTKIARRKHDIAPHGASKNNNKLHMKQPAPQTIKRKKQSQLVTSQVNHQLHQNHNRIIIVSGGNPRLKPRSLTMRSTTSLNVHSNTRALRPSTVNESSLGTSKATGVLVNRLNNNDNNNNNGRSRSSQPKRVTFDTATHIGQTSSSHYRAANDDLGVHQGDQVMVNHRGDCQGDIDKGLTHLDRKYVISHKRILNTRLVGCSSQCHSSSLLRSLDLSSKQVAKKPAPIETASDNQLGNLNESEGHAFSYSSETSHHCIDRIGRSMIIVSQTNSI